MWSHVLKRKNNWVAIIFVFALIKMTIFVPFGAKTLTDDGQNFTAAARLLSGQLPYKNFQSFFSPLSDIFTLTALRLTNFSIIGTRIFYALIASGLFPILYVLTKRLSNFYTAMLITSMILLADIRIDLLFFQTMFLASFWWITRRKIGKASLAITIGSLWRWELAITWIVSILVMLLIKKKTTDSIKFMVLPVIVNSLIIGVLYKFQLLNWGWFDLQAGILAKNIYAINWISKQILFTFPKDLSNEYSFSMGWWYICGLVVLGSWIWRNRQSIFHHPILVGLLTQVGISMLYLKSQNDLGHVLKGGLSLFILLAPAIAKRKMFLPWAGMFLIIQLAFSIWHLAINNTKINLFKGGPIWLPSQYISGTTIPSADMVVKAVQFLRQALANQPVFTVPHLSLLYFLADRHNPTMYDNLLSGYLLPEYGEKKVISDLNSVQYIVYDVTNGPNRLPMQNYYSQIHEYIMTNFVVVDQTGPWLLMQRKKI